MEQCGGALLVHLDASTAACTEELEGRCCAGAHAAHRGGTVSCQDVLGPGGCETCALDSFTERQWRHVAHVGVMARSTRRCLAHVRSRRAPAFSCDFEELLAHLVEHGHAVRHRLPR
jgi:hypothetical protein